MDKKVKNIYTVKLTYKADITLTVEADNGDDALRMATEKAQAADNSEFNIYDEENIEIIGVWTPEEEEKEDANIVAAANANAPVIGPGPVPPIMVPLDPEPLRTLLDGV
jgi:hypothetical protein